MAAVLIHEVVHAYLKEQDFSNQSDSLQHAMIADKFIQPMADFLVSTYSISHKDAFSLAWNGVIDSKVFADADDDDLFVYYYTENNIKSINISKQEIMNRAGAYNGMTNFDTEGIKGSSVCPN